MTLTRKHVLYFYAYELFDLLQIRLSLKFKSLGILRRKKIGSKAKKHTQDFGEIDSDGNIRVSIYKRDRETFV